jgi:hypothetical protein
MDRRFVVLTSYSEHFQQRRHKEMRLMLISSAVVLVLAVVSLVGATPTPQKPQLTSIFGVSKRLPVMSVRGGAVLEPESLDDVESILIKAGSEQKLVVIDFSATW